MTRRVPARSAIAAADSDLARLSTIDFEEVAPRGIGRPRSLADLARLLAPADAGEGSALGWLRRLGGRDN
jgi:hypothetical protein